MKDWEVMETGTIWSLLKKQIRCKTVTGVCIIESWKDLGVERLEKMTNYPSQWREWRGLKKRLIPQYFM